MFLQLRKHFLAFAEDYIRLVNNLHICKQVTMLLMKKPHNLIFLDKSLRINKYKEKGFGDIHGESQHIHPRYRNNIWAWEIDKFW